MRVLEACLDFDLFQTRHLNTRQRDRLAEVSGHNISCLAFIQIGVNCGELHC